MSTDLISLPKNLVEAIELGEDPAESFDGGASLLVRGDGIR